LTKIIIENVPALPSLSISRHDPVMITIIGSLAPIFLLIIVGQGIKRLKILDDTFWMPAEKLTYYITFPALLVVSLSKAKLDTVDVLPLALTVGLATMISAGAALLAKKASGAEGASFTSLFQGSIRPNTYAGIGAALALFGKPGAALLAICIAAVVPLVNFLSVSVMVLHVGRKESRLATLLHGFIAILTNPLILACLIGIGLNMAGIELPFGIAPLLEILGGAALPIGLLAVGAGLDFSVLRQTGRPILFSAILKLLLLPVSAFVLAKIFGLSGTTTALAVAYAALPCSPSAYVLARQMGGDAPMMAGIISLQTILAALTMPILISLAL
jgi:malonate transporter